jgi:hypothetical protein
MKRIHRKIAKGEEEIAVSQGPAGSVVGGAEEIEKELGMKQDQQRRNGVQRFVSLLSIAAQRERHPR